MRWQDFQSVAGPWQGLDLRVERGDLVPGAPHFRVRANRRRMRIECAGEPVLWAHVHAWHYGLWLLLGRRTESFAVVPPITRRILAGIDAAPHGEAWWRAWSRWFARALARSERTPLFPGRWSLTPARAADAPSAPVPAAPPVGSPPIAMVHDVRACLGAPALRWESWFINGSGGLLRARRPSKDAASRPRAFRKRARDGTLPPVLVQHVSGLDMFVLLDGHDRLQAALLEGAAPPLLVLCHLRAQVVPPDPERRDAVAREIEQKRLLRDGRETRLETQAENRLLIAAFHEGEWLSARSLAWPLEGGLERWEQQVLAEGVARDHLLFSGDPPPRG